jgi:hypothetical protein
MAGPARTERHLGITVPNRTQVFQRRVTCPFLIVILIFPQFRILHFEKSHRDDMTIAQGQRQRSATLGSTSPWYKFFSGAPF